MLDRAAATTSAVLALLALGASLVGAPRDGGQATPAAVVPEVLRLPPGTQLTRMAIPIRTEVELSPDGTVVVLSASPDGTMEKARLYRRPLDRPDAAIVPGTPQGACMASFSPDGQWIVYWAGGKLYKVAATGGAPVPLCDLKARPFGISWAPDGRIIFGRGGAGLASVPAAGGTVDTLTTVDATREQTHRLPHVLPGGKGLLFTAMGTNMGLESRLEWLSLETGQRKMLVEDAADGRYLPTGHLVFVRRGALMVVAFDLARLQTSGPVVTAVPQLMQAFNVMMPDMNSAAGQYSVSASGALLWAKGGMLPDVVSQLYWVDRSGRAESWSAFGTRAVGAVRLSPDGRRAVFATDGLDRGVWVYDIRRNSATRLTSDSQTWFVAPSWTPDGKRVAFSWWKNGLHMWLTPADGAGKMEQLPRTEFSQRGSSWTRDGRYLAFVDTGGETGSDINVLRMADRQVTPFAATKAAEVFPEFSPDGRWLAYVSNESGRNEVYVRSFPDGKRTLPISTEGGTSPLWGPGGRELFYWDVGFKKLTRVDVSAGQTLSAGPPRLLFEFTAAASVMIRNYDITPDGQRFLIQKTRNASPAIVTELNLVRRWFDEVKRVSPPTR
ncbi:MAG: TolB family protein [Bacteroidales bacterium]